MSETERRDATSRATPSPLKWHVDGGKAPLARRIAALMPPHLHYVEPYAGGLSVLLAHGGEGRSEVANDINGQLVNFWNCLQCPASFEVFARRIAAVPFCERMWFHAAERVSRPCEAPDTICIPCGAAFFVCCRMSMAGRMASFSPLVKTRLRRGMNDNVSAYLSAVDGLPEVHRRLRRVVILNRPALRVIEQQDGPQTLFYLDPPYLDSTRTAPDVYAHEMGEDDHRHLLDLVRCVRGKVMLSGYPSPLYEQALGGWHREAFDVPNHAASGVTKGREQEILWCNFTPERRDGHAA